MVAFVHAMSHARRLPACAQTVDCLALARNVVLRILQAKFGDAIRRRLPVQFGLGESRMALLPKAAFIVRGALFGHR